MPLFQFKAHDKRSNKEISDTIEEVIRETLATED